MRLRPYFTSTATACAFIAASTAPRAKPITASDRTRRGIDGLKPTSTSAIGVSGPTIRRTKALPKREMNDAGDDAPDAGDDGHEPEEEGE